MKRIITIQDISCVGKCSLTVALPIISAAGVETSVIPTAVLSAHTAFKNYSFKDLTSEITNISESFKKENITFDAIYTGYLGSLEQIKLVSEFIDEFKTKDTLVFIDPVMGDYGKLYSGFTKKFACQMADLCAKADIIVPNMTEATYLLDIPYCENYDENYAKEVLKKLCALGAKNSVLTGINFIPEKLGVMAYNSATDKYFSYFNKKIPKNFHGTGDVFASSCLGAIMKGLDLKDGLEIAADYTLEAIRQTVNDLEHRWYGVNFETALPYYINKLHIYSENKYEKPISL